MIPLTQLWLPILLSAVFVFIVSSLIHMVLKWHNSDYRAFPNEDEVREAIRKGGAGAGMYALPHCQDMKEMGSEAMGRKYAEGPIGMVYLRTPGPMKLGLCLTQWFLFSLGVGLSAAYLASRTLAPGTPYLQVFRITGTIAFLAYGCGSVVAGIWMGQPWKAVAKDLVDAMLYALVTGGAFGWRWPH